MALTLKPQDRPPLSAILHYMPFRRDGSVKRGCLIAIVILLVPLTSLYLWTARIYFEGSLAQNVLVLKPVPSLDTHRLRSEDGWKPDYPGETIPWWESPETRQLAYGGDWEDPVWWNGWYDFGAILMHLLWLVLLYGLARDAIRLTLRAAGLRLPQS